MDLKKKCIIPEKSAGPRNLYISGNAGSIPPLLAKEGIQGRFLITPPQSSPW